MNAEFDALITLLFVVPIAALIGILECVVVAVWLRWMPWVKPARRREPKAPAWRLVAGWLWMSAGAIAACAIVEQFGLIGPVLRDRPNGEVGSMIEAMQWPFYTTSVVGVVVLVCTAWKLGKNSAR